MNKILRCRQAVRQMTLTHPLRGFKSFHRNQTKSCAFEHGFFVYADYFLSSGREAFHISLKPHIFTVYQSYDVNMHLLKNSQKIEDYDLTYCKLSGIMVFVEEAYAAVLKPQAFSYSKKISEGDNYYGKKSRCINQEP